jgi:8-oxo-dGTP pyrophosphatase MutT (NUDIX family)
MNTETKRAGVVLLCHAGKVLAVTRKNDPTKWGLPGGKAEEGESTKAAAARELLEETGIEAYDLIKVFSRVEPGKDGNDFYSVCYYTADFDGNFNDGEPELEKRWVTPEFLIANSPFGEYLRQLFEVTEIIQPREIE